MTSGDDFLFAEGDDHAADSAKAGVPALPWKVMVVDDDREVHAISRIVLQGLRFKDRPLLLLSAGSGEEARKLIEENPDTALILLDVVMETDTAGLDLVRHIRAGLNNRRVQIILRTGQPGLAPEHRVILDYEINDYKDKTELTSQKLSTAVLTTLRSYDLVAELEEKKADLERITTASYRFVPSASLSVLGKTGIEDVALGDQVQQEMAILFADIRGFTRLCERLTPKQTFDFLNSLLFDFGPLIRRHGGFIDKYLGDGILALFPGSADDALNAAIALRRCLAGSNRFRGEDGEAPVRMGFGIHSGTLMLGIVGEPQRMEATVLSDAVNTCSRIESLTKEYGVEALVSEHAVMRLENPDAFRFRYVDKVRIRGRTGSVAVYELLDGEAPEQHDLKVETLAEFERGLSHYRSRRFSESSVHFTRILERNPHDPVARLYLKRAAEYMVQGVPADWPDTP